MFRICSVSSLCFSVSFFPPFSFSSSSSSFSKFSYVSQFSSFSVLSHCLPCSLDSIAVSLSTNSIRRQDPNIYSDTETRALSTSTPPPASSTSSLLLAGSLCPPFLRTRSTRRLTLGTGLASSTSLTLSLSHSRLTSPTAGPGGFTSPLPCLRRRVCPLPGGRSRPWRRPLEWGWSRRRR